MYLLALMTISLAVASLTSRVLIREERRCSIAVSAVIAVSVGWLAGVVIVVTYSYCLQSQSRPLSACGLSLLALLFIFYYAWQSLSSSSTDDLIGLIAVVNASSLAPISLPYLFLLLACCAPSALPAANTAQTEGQDPEQGQSEI